MKIRFNPYAASLSFTTIIFCRALSLVHLPYPKRKGKLQTSAYLGQVAPFLHLIFLFGQQRTGKHFNLV